MVSLLSERLSAAQDLLARLEESGVLELHGYEGSVNPKGDLLVCRRGHWRGMWRCCAGKYGWTIAGSREPEFETTSVDAAVAYAMERVFVA